MLEKINFAKLFNLNLIKTNKFSVTNIIFLQLKLNNVNFTFLFTTVKNQHSLIFFKIKPQKYRKVRGKTIVSK